MPATSLVREINLLNIDSSVIDDAVNIVHDGGVLLYPTDTIYGLGCDAFNPLAIQRIYDIKIRKESTPFLVLTDSLRSVEALVEEIPGNARLLAELFWPGPITLIFRAKNHLPREIVTENRKIGIRIPKHEFCRRLCAQTGTPIVSTSANISGHQQVCSIDILKDLFASKVDLIIDAGDCSSATPSTIVDISGKHAVVLREGVISRFEIESALNK